MWLKRGSFWRLLVIVKKRKFLFRLLEWLKTGSFGWLLEMVKKG